MLKRVLAYGFAFFLLLLEWVFRKLANLNSHEFIGPTLAAAGVGFLVPLISPKTVVPTLPEEAKKQLDGYYIIPKKQQRLVEITLLFLFLLIASWVYDLYLVCKPTSGLLGISPISLGLVTYLAAVVLAEIKESV
jgi:hypothetical protein